jgi:AcrR family transcriptional regulator
MNQDRETRDRLLNAAAALFSERGFKNVTVRDICRSAKANVAAVNYHFGDKLGLYREVLQRAIDGMRRTNQEARAAGEGCAPEEKLRRYIVIFLHNVLKPENAMLHRLVQREIQDPTPVLDAVVEQGVRPRIEYLAGLVAELLGGAPDDRRVLRCVGSIQAQSIVYLPNPVAARLGFSFKPTTGEIEAAADHIAAFSIGGVRALRAARAPDAGPRQQLSRVRRHVLT